MRPMLVAIALGGLLGCVLWMCLCGVVALALLSEGQIAAGLTAAGAAAVGGIGLWGSSRWLEHLNRPEPRQARGFEVLPTHAAERPRWDAGAPSPMTTEGPVRPTEARRKSARGPTVDRRWLNPILSVAAGACGVWAAAWLFGTFLMLLGLVMSDTPMAFVQPTFFCLSFGALGLLGLWGIGRVERGGPSGADAPRGFAVLPPPHDEPEP